LSNFLGAMGEQVSALVEKLELTDAALAEHRRRLVQSEKLSAVGELAAKLAHEMLNPLAGIKTAVHVLSHRRGGAAGAGPGPGAGGVDGEAAGAAELAAAVNREIARVDGLLRRLMSFARPLAPRVQVVSLGAVVDAAAQATAAALARANVTLVREEAAELPPLEVDPLLLQQAIVNLLANAADAMAPAGGGRVTVEVGRAVVHGREEAFVRVTDGGGGISDDALPQLGKPFFTTKPDGHGLGLAVTQNILLEHGGRLVARNRPVGDGPGAVFEVWLPLSGPGR